MGKLCDLPSFLSVVAAWASHADIAHATAAILASYVWCCSLFCASCLVLSWFLAGLNIFGTVFS